MGTATEGPLRVFLCDPTHDTILPVSDTIPINIGFIASYAKTLFGDDIEISLFKYPRTIIDAIDETPPDVIGLSNYSWNSWLSERLARYAKEKNPEAVTVQGGTNFPHRTEQQLTFLLERPGTDIHVELEGEVSFSNILRRVLEFRTSALDVLREPIDGCVFIAPRSRESEAPRLVKGLRPPRVRDLDEVPSPYLNGMLDHFFDGRLTPFLETNRGCPFRCSFCHTGNLYFQKINNFSVERVREEIAYIAERAAPLGIRNLHIADTNFGMYPRDREICAQLKKAHDETGWPNQIMSTTGKNNKERVIEITDIMGAVFAVNMSVQSMNEDVLSNINRDNIRLDDYIRINSHLREKGRSTKAELIMGLPGESKETFLKGLSDVADAGVSLVLVYTLMLLHGTEFQDPEFREKWRIKGKYRLVPLNFGEYAGERVFDYEEVGIQTKDMSFDDYLFMRGMSFLIGALSNGHAFEEFFRCAAELGRRRMEFLQDVKAQLDEAPDAVRDVFDSFMRETRDELWDDAAEMIGYYSEDENYQKIIDGEAGNNVLYKHAAQTIATSAHAWADFLSQVCASLAREHVADPEELEEFLDQIETLRLFSRNRMEGLLDVDGNVDPVSMISTYDVARWLAGPANVPLSHYRTDNPMTYEFYYTAKQIKDREEHFSRYGTTAAALSKIVTRVSNVESLFRKVRTGTGETSLFADTETDRFVRYASSV